jgi:hypothetical protein
MDRMIRYQIHNCCNLSRSLAAWTEHTHKPCFFTTHLIMLLDLSSFRFSFQIFSHFWSLSLMLVTCSSHLIILFMVVLKILGEKYRLLSLLTESLLLSFWTLSIVRISTNRKHNVSETGSVSIFRWGGGDTYSTEKQKFAFPQAMPEQKEVNYWKQGDYKHLTAGRVHGM